MHRPSALAVLATLPAACHDAASYAIASGPRDWATAPALATVSAPTRYAVSDVHGGYDRLIALLAANGLVDAAPTTADAVRWTGGDAALIVVGDLIDKGPDALAVIDALRALEPQAAAAGGQLVVLFGNHEAEFFADPTNSKADSADGIDAQLAAAHQDPVALASGADPRGAWLRARPFGVRAGAWFFAHAGNAGGRTFDALGAELEAAYDANDLRDDEFIGASSLLEARDWYTDATTVAADAQALGVAHIVFGHDPNALGPRGAIASAQGGALVRIDCGMSPDVDDSHGALLRVRATGSGDVADQLDATGAVTALWP